MFKTELLAPAGSYEALVGAINAGADAIYLGGSKFGARAYAGNFTEEELVEGLRFAHLFGKKIYLTLNTLIKEAEYSQLKDFLTPYYEEGLDGIIVQDIGVMKFVHENFPLLPLHVSTQAFVTGALGAEYLKKLGAVRVVPARELSLKEIIEIKEKTGLEIETFIHGAMCYCYSGQCLFSSAVGGRSGNRGRCAQPCRLPYSFNFDGNNYFSKEKYPLSLKDMCTVYDLPSLLEAGIDSFKIEGRMKKPEYVAGVVAIYRKYIDMYYDNPKNFKGISSEDEKTLKSLYIRSEIQNGYYFKHNGADMITLNSPAYSPTQDSLLLDIREKYLADSKKAEIGCKVYCHVGEPLKITFDYNGIYASASSEAAIEVAGNRPATYEDIKKSVGKLGNTDFVLKDFELDLSGDCFVPVKVINDVRRQAIETLLHQHIDAILIQRKASLNVGDFDKKRSLNSILNKSSLEVLINTKDQLKALSTLSNDIENIRVIVDFDLYISRSKEIKELGALEVFIALPFVLRSKDVKRIKDVLEKLNVDEIKGVLVRNPEELELVRQLDSSPFVISDAGLYCFNKVALEELQSNSDEITLPLELSNKEKRSLLGMCKEESVAVNIYGRIPMMITANCVYKTAGRCQANSNNEAFGLLKDRLGNEFPVIRKCNECMNIIYNCVPLSAHKYINDYRECTKRINFTVEDYRQTKMILSLYLKLVNNPDLDISVEINEVIKNYTTGHEKRGVE